MIALPLALLLASSAFAQAPVLEPLGLALENHPYPHPVRFFPVTVEGQDLRMAYMDVAPTAAAAPSRGPCISSSTDWYSRVRASCRSFARVM